MRVLVLVLLAANVLFFLLPTHVRDAFAGVSTEGVREPKRVAAQQHPERITPLAASAVAALAQKTCLALGPLEGDAALAAAQAALQNAAPGADWQVRSSEQAGVWAVATIKLGDPDFRARKEATYKQLRIAYEPLTGLPAEQPAFVLSRHATQAEAAAEIAALEKRGLKGLRALALQAPKARHTVVVPQADGLLAGKLKALKDPALGEGFHACGADAAAPAASAAG